MNVFWNINQKKTENYNFLTLPVVDSKTNIPINTLNEIINKYFDEEMIKRACHTCSSNSAKKTEHITKYPQVLLLQYNRYNAQQTKIDHPISVTTSLQLGNVQYQLTGFVMHRGPSVHSGHYEAVTLCWETEKAYLLMDNRDPKPINHQEMVHDLQHAYILVFCKKKTTQDMAEEMAATIASDEELPSPGYVPLGTRKSDENKGYNFNEEESTYIKMLEEINTLNDIPPKERTDEQKKRLRNMKAKQKKIENNFKHLGEFVK